MVSARQQPKPAALIRGAAGRIKYAERSQLIQIYDQYRALSNDQIRRAVIERNRIDILAREILGYTVTPGHLKMMQFQFLHRDSLQLAYRGFGKTTVLTVTKAIHYLIKDRDFRILLASKTKGNAGGFLKEIRGHLENNQRLIEVFGPFYDPSRVSKWDNTEIEILGKKKATKEASITCVGVDSAVVSRHYDAIIGDDLVDDANARTHYMREVTRVFYYQTLLPTLEPPDVAVPHRGENHKHGTRYHFAELYGHLIENELKEHHQIIPAFDEEERSPWPEKHPPEWFKERRQQMGTILFNCHSADTEYLTENGWRLFGDVLEAVRLATYNVATRMIEFEAPLARISYQFDGEMLHLRNRDIDALVTPNHRFWVRPAASSVGLEKPWSFVTAEELREMRDGVGGRVEIPAFAQEQIASAMRAVVDNSYAEPPLGSVLTYAIVPEKQIRGVSYSGPVTCFTMLNGTLITRRNGRVLVSGNCQYQNNTDAMKGEIFQYDDCQQIDEADYPKLEDMKIFAGVDLAISEDEENDQFAIVTLGMVGKFDAPTIYVLDYFAGRLRFSEQTDKIVEHYKRWQPIRLGIEANAYQAAQYHQLREKHPELRVRPLTTDKDKVTRAWKLSAHFEDGRVFFKKNVHGPIIDQLVLFPHFRYKDLFDAFDLAVTISRKRGTRKRRREPGLI